MKVRVSLNIGYSNAMREDVLELDDDLTDDQIDEAVQDWTTNYIDVDWERLEE